MFVAGYPFQKVKTVKHDPLNPHLVSNILYRFDTRKGNRYLVEVHEHNYKVFVVKFYLSKDRNNKKKYNILTNTYEWGGVLRTILTSAYISMGWNTMLPSHSWEHIRFQIPP